MKKVLISVLTILALTGCTGLTSKTEYKAHWFSRRMCYEIESYQKQDNVYRIDFKDYGRTYISCNDIMIVEDKCPICDSNKGK